MTGTGRGAPRIVKRRSAAERGSIGKINVIVWISEVRSGSMDDTRVECPCLTGYLAGSAHHRKLKHTFHK